MTAPQLLHAISWLTSSPGFLSHGSHPICHINSPHTNPLHHTSLFNDIYIFLTNSYEISHPKKLNLQRTSAPWLTGDYITLETQCLLGHSDTASQASESDGTALLPLLPHNLFHLCVPVMQNLNHRRAPPKCACHVGAGSHYGISLCLLVRICVKYRLSNH